MTSSNSSDTSSTNGYTNGGVDWIDVLAANEAGGFKGLIDALKDTETGKFADEINAIVREVYEQGGNRAVERVAPFIEDLARYSPGVQGYLRNGAQALNNLDDFKLIKNVKAGPLLDAALAGASVYNDYRNGENWVSEIFKQGASIAAGAGAAALTTAGIAAAGVTAPAWGTALAVGVVAAGASYAVAEAWDFVEGNWDNITDWTDEQLDAARASFDEIVDGAADWMSDRATEFSDWAGDRAQEFSDWADAKAEQVSDIYDYVKDRAGEFGQEVVDFWQDAKDSVAGAVDEAGEWLNDRWSDISETGQELWDTAGDWLEEQRDRIKDGFEDASTALEDWVGNRAEDLSNAVNDVTEGASDLWQDLKDWWNGDDQDAGEDAQDASDRSGSARTEASPLVLDLDGDGIELTGLGSAGAVYWDIDVDGFRERSGWVGADDGLLVLDANLNGRIDDHSELFGTATVDGFTVLSVLDSNNDGWISSDDDAFDSLQVWRDIDQNGQSDAGELFSLDTAGVARINLGATLVSETIAGNAVTHRSTYVGTDGASHQIVDAWFAYDNLNSRLGRDVPFDALAQSLPQVRGYGVIADLRAAMSLDETLRDMILEIADTPADRVFAPEFDLEGKLKAAMFRWAGVQDIDPQARGRYVDGRELGFVEAFTDRPFAQNGRPNPAPEAGRTLTSAFDTIFNATLTKIFVQSMGEALFADRPIYFWEQDQFSAAFEIDFDALETLVTGYAAQVSDMAPVWVSILRVLDHAVGIDTLSAPDRARLDALAQTHGSVSVENALDVIYPPVALGLNGTNGDDNLRGGGGRDNLSTGDGDDRLFGLRGDDNLQGGRGNDTLSGGAGNDLVQGGPDNDTYIYRGGFETYIDSSGVDRIIIGAGLEPRDLAYLRSPDNQDDLEIYARGELIIRVEGFFGPDGEIEKISFEGVPQVFDLGELAKGIKGTSGDDRIDGDQNAFTPNDRILGLKGDDRLRGFDGADVLIGGDGRDTLGGGDGSDVLLGGSGNDRIVGGRDADNLQGGSGNDTYFIQDDDVIFDTGGTDTVVLRKTLGFDDITLARLAYSNDLLIETPYETVRVTGHFGADANAIERIARQRDNGSLEMRAISTLPIEQYGTENYDRMRGDLGGVAAEDILRGRAGNDYLYSYAGADLLDGGLGDDHSYGGAGGDTYVVGYGHDFIQDYTTDLTDAIDRVMISGINRGDAALSRMLDGDIMVSWQGGSVRIDRGFDERYAVERILFANGAATVAGLALRTFGTDGADQVYGNREELGSHDDRLFGAAGNDRIYGYDGDDRLFGDAGDDSLYGAEGSDTYYVGGGDDYVSDYGATDDADDVLRIKGVRRNEATIERRSDGDLVIAWADGSVIVNNAFDARYAVERIVFDDGTLALDAVAMITRGTNGSESIYGNREERGSRDDSLVARDGNDAVYGYDGDDTLNGGLGDDSLYGADGSDRYIVGQGDDFVQDRGGVDAAADIDIVRIQGVDRADTTLRRLGDGDLLIGWDGGSVRIDQAFDERNGIERIAFDNATLQMAALITNTYGTNGNDRLDGNREERGSRNDRLFGLDGDDTLYGYDGDDVLDAGAGNDSLYGGEGADIYRLSTGHHYIQDYTTNLMDGPDRIRVFGYDLSDATFTRSAVGTLKIDWGEGSVRINRAFVEGYSVESIRFDRGSVDLTTLAVETHGTNGDEKIYGNLAQLGDHNDTILGLDGDDTLYSYDGQDVLDGGMGDDLLAGAEGGDTYILGAGHDTIEDRGAKDLSDGDDTARIPVALADVEIRYVFGALLMSWDGGSVRVKRAFYERDAVERFVFADQTVALDDLRFSNIGTNGADWLRGNSGDYGSRDDSIFGLDGDDNLYGYDGNDRLRGDAGNDSLYGADGADIYITGQGHDYIQDQGLADLSDGDDLLRVLGVDRADATLTRLLDGDLLIDWGVGSVRIDRAFEARYAVEHIAFRDEQIQIADLAVTTRGTNGVDTIYGNREDLGSRNDRLEGLDGADRLYGYDGDDTYVVGDGDRIYESNSGGNDRIVLPDGVDPADVRYEQLDTRHLVIRWGAASVVVDSFFSGPGHAVETLEFADGTLVDLSTITPLPVTSPRRTTKYGDDTANMIAADPEGSTIYGYDGNDTLQSGTGQDSLYGAAGADRYVVGPGDAFVSDRGAAADGNDVVEITGVNRADTVMRRLNDGDIRVTWDGGSVRIDQGFDSTYAIERIAFADQTVNTANLKLRTEGTGGADTLYGNRQERGSRDDLLFGLDGNDRLYGYDGNDRLNGGLGNDEMYGAEGGDTYLVGYGHDYISDRRASDDPDDRIIFQGLDQADVSMHRRSDGDVLMSWSGGSVLINEFFDPRYAIESLTFRDATVSTEALAIATHGTGGADTLYGNRDARGLRDDLIRGFDGHDALYAYDGNDTLDGGLGNDSLYGSTGADRYLVGAGHDFVSDRGSADGGDDVVVIQGVNRADVVMRRLMDGDIYVTWDGGSVRIDQGFDDTYAIERIAFDDRTIGTATLKLRTEGTGGDDTVYGNRQERGSRDDALFGLDGDDRLYGYDGNDRLIGGLGNDTLYGADGGDLYFVGEGHDYISDRGTTGDADDRVVFRGLDRGDVSMHRQSDGDVVVEWAGGSVRIDNLFSAIYAIETFTFGDGGLSTEMLGLATHGTGGNDTLYGNREARGSHDDLILGFDGNDAIYGYDGNDTLDGGLGDDSLYGATGADRYLVGSGDDFVSDRGAADDGNDVVDIQGVNRADVVMRRLIDGDIHVTWDGGSVRIDQGFDAAYGIERIAFDDRTINTANLKLRTDGTGGSETLSGNREARGSRDDVLFGLDGDDRLYGYDGNDRLNGGAGNDTLYGAEGDDFYFVGEGRDVINEGGSGSTGDVLVLPGGMGLDDVSFERVENRDLKLSWDGGEALIQYQFYGSTYAIEQMRFGGGSAFDLDFV